MELTDYPASSLVNGNSWIILQLSASFLSINLCLYSFFLLHFLPLGNKHYDRMNGISSNSLPLSSPSLYFHQTLGSRKELILILQQSHNKVTIGLLWIMNSFVACVNIFVTLYCHFQCLGQYLSNFNIYKNHLWHC